MIKAQRKSSMVNLSAGNFSGYLLNTRSLTSLYSLSSLALIDVCYVTEMRVSFRLRVVTL
jgi:hypothetical protein